MYLPARALSAYTADGCRCEMCRAVFAAYRACHRAAGQDGGGAIRPVDSDGHLSRDWFTKRIWKSAYTASDIAGTVRIATTERYLHTLPTADDTALDALTKIRRERAT
jgi:hypothetical protein